MLSYNAEMIYQFAELNGTKLHYQSTGQGRPMIFIHAGIAHLGMWDEQVAAFSPQYRTIRYDVRGWGESADPAGTFAHHEDTLALLDYLGEKEAIIVGASNGGTIALDFSLTYPERTAALILVGPALSGYDFTMEGIADKNEALIEAYERGDKDTAAEYEAQIWVDGPGRNPDQVDAGFRRRALAMIRHIFDLPDGAGQGVDLDPPAIDRLGEIQTPALLILGEHDVPDIFAIAQHLTGKMPDIRQVLMPTTAHLPNMERPAEFNQAVRGFLQSVA
jgi:pimeloyl-ACP methyl ester carboxylesterase